MSFSVSLSLARSLSLSLYIFIKFKEFNFVMTSTGLISVFWRESAVLERKCAGEIAPRLQSSL